MWVVSGREGVRVCSAWEVPGKDSPVVLPGRMIRMVQLSRFITFSLMFTFVAHFLANTHINCVLCHYESINKLN